MIMLSCEVHFFSHRDRAFLLSPQNGRPRPQLLLVYTMPIPSSPPPTHMHTYHPPEIPVGWPQPDVWSLVFIKGPDSLLESLLMERNRAPHPEPDASTALSCDVMTGAPIAGASLFADAIWAMNTTQWYDRDEGGWSVNTACEGI